MTSASRTRTVIEPKSAAETLARTIAVTRRLPRGARAPQRRSRGGLGDEDPGHHHRAAEPADPPQHLVREQHPRERGERRLEREHERGARGRRARLHPRRDQVAERAREDASHDQRAPDRRSARHLELSECKRDDGEADERRGHHEKRQRARVVAGGKTFHRGDLQCLENGVGEHERVPERRPSRNTVQQQQPYDG